MQTFLPYPDFAKSARVLDNRRLGKQRVEAWQILQAITRPGYGWQHHPAVKMWRGASRTLAAYGIAVCNEWKARSFKDSMHDRFLAFLKEADGPFIYEVPFWLGLPPVHASHRSNLLRKLPSWYSQFGWTEPPTLPYVWPDCPG